MRTLLWALVPDACQLYSFVPFCDGLLIFHACREQRLRNTLVLSVMSPRLGSTCVMSLRVNQSSW